MELVETLAETMVADATRHKVNNKMKECVTCDDAGTAIRIDIRTLKLRTRLPKTREKYVSSIATIW